MNRTNHKFSENVIIYEGAIVPESCEIGPFSIIYPGVEFEENVKIGSSCIIGKKPTTGSNQTKLLEFTETLRIQKNTIICDQVIIYTGCYIGEDCYLADRAFIRENVNIGRN